MALLTHTLSFNGPLLKRGFWLYVWEISDRGRVVYYVGRTGDNSSSNASSPFARVGMHFNLRPNAKGNSLIRRLREGGFDPERCEYRMAAVGPIFPEQPTFYEHVPYRDIVATLEHHLAETLRGRDLVVIGRHHPGAPLNRKLFAKVLRKFDTTLFRRKG